MDGRQDSASLDAPRTRRRRARRRTRVRDIGDPVAVVLHALLVVGSVLALGTVHSLPLLIVALLALVGGFVGAAGVGVASWVTWVIFGLGVFSVVQALPIPIDWLERLSPASADVWARSLRPFGEEPPKYGSLSVDRGATVLDSLKWLSYAAAVPLAMRVRKRRGSAWLASVLFASASLVAVITLFHGVLDTRDYLGWIGPNFSPRRWNVGPLLNSNNLAGYLNLGLFCGIGLALAEPGRSPLPKALIAAGSAPMVVALLLSTSRAGVVCCLLGVLLVGVWLIAENREGPSTVTAKAGLALGGLGALALFARSAWDFSALTSADTERKVAVWVASLPMLRDFPVFGIGRGAFETGFPRYRPVLSHDWTAVFAHAENFVVQWVSEWGLVVGGLATLGFCAFLVVCWLRARREDALRFCIVTGVAVFVLQNLVDLGTEIPALCFAVITALVAGVPTLASSKSASAPAPKRWPALLVVASGAAVWLVAAVWFHSTVGEERRRLTAEYRALDVDAQPAREAFFVKLRDAISRHPAEPHFALLGGLVASRAKEQSTLAWLSRALELGPYDARVHMALSRVFAARGAIDQAMLHLRFATEQDVHLTSSAAQNAAAWATSAEHLLRAAPDGRRGDELLSAACRRLGGRPMYVPCLRARVTRSPGDLQVRAELAEALLRALHTKSSACSSDRDACIAELEQNVLAMQRVNPKDWRAHHVRARVLSLQGKQTEAAKLMAEVCPSGPPGRACSWQLLHTALSARADELVQRAVELYTACSLPSDCAQHYESAAGAVRNHYRELAVQLYRKAAEKEPTASRWILVAESAAALDDHEEALSALGFATRAPGADLATHERVSRLRNQVRRDMFDGG